MCCAQPLYVRCLLTLLRCHYIHHRKARIDRKSLCNQTETDGGDTAKVGEKCPYTGWDMLGIESESKCTESGRVGTKVEDACVTQTRWARNAVHLCLESIRCGVRAMAHLSKCDL